MLSCQLDLGTRHHHTDNYQTGTQRVTRCRRCPHHHHQIGFPPQ